MMLISTHRHRLLHCFTCMFGIFSKAIQPYDFIKRSAIRKLTCKIKYIRINGGLIMFFWKFENKIFWLELVG